MLTQQTAQTNNHVHIFGVTNVYSIFNMVAKLSESTEIAVPLKNIIGMFVAVAAGTGAYFSVMESINSINHRLSMVSMDMKQNSEFRIRWPRGELGSLPADARQDLLIDSLNAQVARLEKRLEKVDDLQVKVKLVEQKLEGLAPKK
jgi:hypothetical protein